MDRGKSKGMLVNQIARLESAIEERDVMIAKQRKQIAELQSGAKAEDKKKK